MLNDQMRFSINPTSLNIGRSRFSLRSDYKTTFNVGDLIPFYVQEVLPGDTFKVRTSKVVRLQTPVTPFMDNIYLDTYYYFVPNRLVWEHWQNLMGENSDSAWIPQVEYEVPQVVSPATTGWTAGTIADYMGVPTGIPDLSVNALFFRAYAKIVEDWYRSENLQDPVNIPVDETTVTGSNGDNYITDLVKGGKPFVAGRFHDYFSSALPGPQKGNPVGISLGSDIPVFGNGTALGLKGYVTSQGGSSTDVFMGLHNSILSTSDSSTGIYASFGEFGKDIGYFDSTTKSRISPGATGVPEKSDFADADDYYKTGLIADLSSATAISVNTLRIAFQLQKLYEKDARGGSRYIELLKSHFGVQSPDARLQRSEYLGGNRIPINVNQVVQQSSTDSTSPQGHTAAYSLTTDTHHDFVKSFTEHGVVIGVMVARYDHTYQQGLNRMWTRKGRFDYYWPVLANIGEQPILNKEIYCQGTDDDEGVFGYQEAWADYRYKPSMVTGEMRSNYTTPLDMWHLADNYASLPYLSSDWLKEDKTNVDRVLAVTSATANQLFMDCLIDNEATRPMPMYSIPGLIDHN